MSTPTQELVNEHSAINSMLQVLQAVCSRLESRSVVPSSDLLQIVDFFIGFADGCHHRKEELCLFPWLESVGVPREGGPIGVMLAEHELGRKHVRGMTAAIASIDAGADDAHRAFVSEARAYVNLLHFHILKENNILFPLAEARIPEEAKEELTREFERVEHEEVGPGPHEAYHTTMSRLRSLYSVS